MHEGRTGSGTIDILAHRYWGRAATEEEKQHIYAVKSELFAALPEALPMQGAMEALQAAREKGLLIVLVTGSATTSLLNRLEKHYPGFFDAGRMVTGFDVKYGKPHPEPYLMGLQKAGVRAEEAIVVENAPLGVESAHRAGIYIVAANTGPLPDQVLTEAGADVVLPGMKEVAGYIRALP